MSDDRHHVVVVGGGFGGINAVRALAPDPRIRVTLLDRRNFHNFQPLLYQVATGLISSGDMSSPLRIIFRKHRNVSVVLGEARDLDPARRELLLADGQRLPYDTLIVAAGARHAYFGHDEWEPLAPGLKSVEDALEIRRRILGAFEMAEREADPERRAMLLTFIIVGGGPTGVELAGSLAEIARHALTGAFRRIRSAAATIVLIDAGERILSTFEPGLSARAQAELVKRGVTVLNRSVVTDVRIDGVTIQTADGERMIPGLTVLWAAGVRAASFAGAVAMRTGAETDRAGHLVVGSDLSLSGHPEILAVGDVALLPAADRPLPWVAPLAIQQGGYAGGLVRARLDGEESPRFRYRDKGSLAVLGRGAGLAQIGPLRFDGALAWLAWLFVHLLYLIGFANRVVVLTRWVWTFMTKKRGAMLIEYPARPAPRPSATVMPAAIDLQPVGADASGDDTVRLRRAVPVGPPPDDTGWGSPRPANGRDRRDQPPEPPAKASTTTTD